MIWRHVHKLLLSLAGMASAGAVLADETTVGIGVIQHTPPYVTENPSSGLDNEIVRAAFGVEGRAVVFYHAPLSRLASLLVDDKVDAITSFDPQADGCFLSDIFTYWHDGVIVRAELRDKVHSVADLKGLRVGTFPHAEKALGDLLVPYVAGFSAQMAVFRADLVAPMLERGRLDAYIGDLWTVAYAYREAAGDPAKSLPYAVAVEFPPTPRYLCFSDADLVPVFNRGLAEIRKRGIHDAIVGRYSVRP
ncbi:MAG: transporter substrate-binding domain-containing protein [Alphaproteobacteria bacterium]|nr:MAG: transporter substrate-binding domain-containing protein [Alphaproteobacteria bacterium]